MPTRYTAAYVKYGRRGSIDVASIDAAVTVFAQGVLNETLSPVAVLDQRGEPVLIGAELDRQIAARMRELREADQ